MLGATARPRASCTRYPAIGTFVGISRKHTCTSFMSSRSLCSAATACTNFKERCNRKAQGDTGRCKRHADQDRFPAHASAASVQMRNPFASTPAPRSAVYDLSYESPQSPTQQNSPSSYLDDYLPQSPRDYGNTVCRPRHTSDQVSTNMLPYDDGSAAHLQHLRKDYALLKSVSHNLCTSIAQQTADADAQKTTIDSQAETIAQLIEKSNAANHKFQVITEQRAADKVKMDQLEQCVHRLSVLVTGQQERLNALQQGAARHGHDLSNSVSVSGLGRTNSSSRRVDPAMDMRMPESRRGSLASLLQAPSSARTSSDARSRHQDTPSRGLMGRRPSEIRHERSSVGNGDGDSPKGSGLLDSRHSSPRHAMHRDLYREDKGPQAVERRWLSGMSSGGIM
jgi:hypothetical protein